MSAIATEVLIDLKGVSKTYGEHQVKALEDVSVQVYKGEFLALMGPSGGGKSTLLNLLGGIDKPESGSILFDGLEITSMADEALTELRRSKIGFVFQFFNLLSTLTVAENVALPLELQGKTKRAQAKARAIELLSKVGMESRADFYPHQLSGGEMQRTAIARALIHRPRVILADEPTGNLDTDNGKKVLDLLCQANRDLGVTIIMATHSEEAAQKTDRTIRIRDGKAVAERQEE